MLVKTSSGDHFLAYDVCDPEKRLKKKNLSLKSPKYFRITYNAAKNYGIMFATVMYYRHIDRITLILNVFV